MSLLLFFLLMKGSFTYELVDRRQNKISVYGFVPVLPVKG